jgi:RNA polymerase sigma-70 factor (ECF subfamily)
MDDVSAIAAVRNGSAEAFRHIVDRYQRVALAHAITLVRDRGEAEDALQEAYVDAFRALARFDTSRPFYSWFYVLLRNRCYKRLRARARAGVPTPVLPSIVAPRAGTEVDVDALRAALAQLDPDDRELITLKHLDGCTYTELAERLKQPKGTLMRRLYEARQRLRALLERHPSFQMGGNA